MWYFPMLVSLNTMAEKEYPMVEDIQPFGGVSHSALLFQVSCISVFCFIGRGSSSRAAYSGRLSPQQHWTEKTMHSWRPLLFPSLCQGAAQLKLWSLFYVVPLSFQLSFHFLDFQSAPPPLIYTKSLKYLRCFRQVKVTTGHLSGSPSCHSTLSLNDSVLRLRHQAFSRLHFQYKINFISI